MHLIGIMENELGVEAEKEMLPMQPGDVPATYAAIDRAREKLGYEPPTPIETGVPKFLQWYKETTGGPCLLKETALYDAFKQFTETTYAKTIRWTEKYTDECGANPIVPYLLGDGSAYLLGQGGVYLVESP